MNKQPYFDLLLQVAFAIWKTKFLILMYRCPKLSSVSTKSVFYKLVYVLQSKQIKWEDQIQILPMQAERFIFSPKFSFKNIHTYIL